jgi:dipeptide/tripeptide permease
MTKNETKSNWKFSQAFWVANSVELLERAAYYAMFIVISIYLTDDVGFSDIGAGWVAGIFAAGLYFLPTFTGALADKIGFRMAVILAFSLLTVGYLSLGMFPYKSIVPLALFLVMIGGSFIKSIITGTVARETNQENRARAYSVFYAIVNVGAFLGKTIAYPVRIELGTVAINYYAAALTFIAVIAVSIFYKTSNTSGEGKSIAEIWQSLLKLLKQTRLIVLIVIITGFWMIQHQLYASMPKYIIRTVGAGAAPEWYANVNPFVVVVFVVFITQIMRKVKALTSMTIGMFLMPLSAFAMSMGPWLQGSTGDSISFGFFSLHPIAVMMIVGISIQALAETFISPRFLEYFSLQSPKGEEGLYLGFSHMHSFLANLLGFISSGYLLDAYVPDPKTLAPEQLATAYEHAHYIWYFYSAIGFVAAISLVIYGIVTKRMEKNEQIIINNS